MWRFPDLPGGLNQDEASAGYESFALLTDGWGSGQNVLLSYLSMPFIALFGLTTFSIRLVPVLLGIGAIPLLYFALRRFVNLPTALIGAGLLAITPWHVTASRWALESSILPFFLLAGVTTLGYAYTSSRARYLIPFSLVFLALALYAYGVAILVVPVIVGLYLCTRYRTVLRNPVPVGLSMLGFLVAAGPLLLFVLVNNVLHRTPGFVSALPFSVPKLVSSRLDQITSGQDLVGMNTHFVTGGFVDGYLWTVPNGFLPLGVIGFPLAALGVYFAARARTPEANLTRHPEQIAESFGAGFDGALRSANEAQHADEPVCISDRMPLNYMETLFYLRTDPTDFRAHAEFKNVDGVYDVRNYRHYYFRSNEKSLDAAPSYVAVLRGDERRECARVEALARHGQWTVVRCVTR
ncbi:ArnT family glycosyltransferase [Streptomyces nojiriensis]|uniref:ArnT family glycosyltransferase n=1 Tax=Streptomyces nojiriensis TaxID=66374 RepID=UPI00364658E3